MNRPRKKNAHLPPCVYPKHGAYYHVKRGKWTRLPAEGPSTLATALEAYAALHETPKGGMPALIDEVIAAMKVQKPPLAPSTLKHYAKAAKVLKRKFAQFAPEQVQGKHVAQFKKDLASTPNMANRCLSVLRQVFSYALEQQLITNNPAIGVERYTEAKRTRLISIDEYVAIYAKAGPRLQVIMDLLIRTGERINDVLKIHRTDLLPEGIRFIQQKTGAKRVVPWKPELRAVTDRAKLLNGNIRSLTLLCNRRGKPPDYVTVNGQWNRACRAAGVENATIHDLRAVAATWAKKQGLDPTALLGHSSKAQTERYLRDREEVLAEGPSFGHLIDGVTKKP